jgi:phosphatidylserine decarboxylase
MLKFAPEGKPFIAVFFALTVVSIFVFGPMWTLVPLALLFFMLYFFRDPERVTPFEPGYISPADGRILFTEHEPEEQFLGGRKVMKVSIFMSPFNVHVNRVPCDGEVVDVKHKPGSFMAAYRKEASWKNENTAMHLKCDEGPDIVVRQVAGFVARRTVCRAKPGDRLERGARYGIIKFSSRLDVYLPEDVELKVKPGDRVYAGETILALQKEGG